MDWWLTWQILQVVLSLGAMVLAIVSILFVWRLRGLFHWRRYLQTELKNMTREAEVLVESDQQALKIVLERCQRAWHAHFPELRELTDLPEYVRSIAAFYHPGKEKPELCITIGRFLNSARESVERLELILRRPGFQRLRRVRIRHIRQSYEWYDRLNRYWIIRYFNRHWKIISKIFHLRLVILPDPFSWLAYFSNRLTMLILTRCLLVDIYLVVGKMAIEAYHEQDGSRPFVPDELEKSLEDLDSLPAMEPVIMDPRIREIRNRLVGFGTLLISTPGPKQWKKAVGQAAGIIAERYFPDAERPLEEAAIGPLLRRSQFWIKSLCESEKMPVVKRFHRIKIESLYTVKSFSEDMLPKPLRTPLKKAWNTVTWMRWPIKVYRWVKKGSPAGIAVEVGWILSKKGFINLICRRTFDMACEEIELIYSQSWTGKQG